MTTNAGNLQRRWKRFNVRIPTDVEMLLDGQSLQFHSTGSDISQGGLSLFIPRNVPVGCTVKLVLRLPYSRETVRVRGVIRNSHGFDYGIEFLSCTSLQWEIIAKNCRALELLE